jgi:cbb3-type cytochrome oxidase subunit 1
MSRSQSSCESASRPVAGAVWHALAWLVFGNAIGVMIAILLLAPSLNVWLGEWTYGRWMMPSLGRMVPSRTMALVERTHHWIGLLAPGTFERQAVP